MKRRLKKPNRLESGTALELGLRVTNLLYWRSALVFGRQGEVKIGCTLNGEVAFQ